MLVLSRKNQEAVIIEVPRACTLRIVVTETRSFRTKMGFECPDDVVILREELDPLKRPIQILAAKEAGHGPTKVA